MSDWSLKKLLENLHDDLQSRLEKARSSFGHPVVKGDASEGIWLRFFQDYLPKRYQAEKAFIVDSKGNFSDQIDVVIFDRQYSPFIFNFEGQIIIPSESVYAVFEAKQTVNAAMIEYAQNKVKSVRQLHQTSLPIPHAGGLYPAKPAIKILGGILTFESDWSPALGDPMERVLKTEPGVLNLGCVASHGYFNYDEPNNDYIFYKGGKPAAGFLFKLISELQLAGTVPMIDVLAYSEWLAPPVTVI
jgi:hypothetical protein